MTSNKEDITMSCNNYNNVNTKTPGAACEECAESKQGRRSSAGYTEVRVEQGDSERGL
jgi:hypothetical protein